MKKIYFMPLLLLILPVIAYPYKMEDCIRCHSGGSKDSVLLISMADYHNSAHGGEIACWDCHSNVKDEGHKYIKGIGAVDCGQCHEQENRHGLSGKRAERPQCHSCHGKHNILGRDNNASTVNRNQLKNSCEVCHSDEIKGDGYLSWFSSLRIKSHKKQDLSQEYSRFNCIGCHQGQAVHGDSGVVDGQKCHVCHMGLKDRAAVMGYIHPKSDINRQPVTFGAAIIYQVFIIFILWRVIRFVRIRISGRSLYKGE